MEELMNESILDSIKLLLGVDPSYEAFDQILIMHINSAFLTLWQIGIGTADCFSITDKAATWSEFIGDTKSLEILKTYIAKRVRINWDTPTSATVLEALKAEIAQDEWRISLLAPIN